MPTEEYKHLLYGENLQKKTIANKAIPQYTEKYLRKKDKGQRTTDKGQQTNKQRATNNIRNNEHFMHEILKITNLTLKFDNKNLKK